MKSFLIFFFTIFSFATYAQGTINFANIVARQGVNAPVYESDGVTKIAGSQFMAELLAGPSAGNLASIATTGFLTGNGAGYFQAGSQAVNGILPGLTAWVQVDVWNTLSGSTFSQAKASGLPNSWWASSTFSVVLGGGSVNPTLPAPLTGLGTSPVFLNSVPEPSMLGFLGLGLAVSLLRNRRRDRPAVSN